MGPLRKFIAETRRRKVVRTGGLYIVGAWVLLQVAELALESFGLPTSLLRYFWAAGFVGLPLALVFGWYYEISPEGIRKTPPASEASPAELALKIPDYVLIGALAIVAGLVAAGILDRARSEAETSGGGIAVLPLENLSGDPGQDYFSAGMHDALITSLSKIGALRVVSRTSTLRVGADATMRQIGQLLGVAHVIEGSVAREGGRVRIIVQLIDAERDAHVWAESFEREFTSVLTLQNDMARAIATAVNVQLSDTEQAALGDAPPVDPDIYDTYLRGMHLVNQASTDARKRGIGILEEVVEKDPRNALAYAGLAYGYAILGHSPLPEGMYEASKLASSRALELDDTLAEAHLSVGMLELYYEWDFPAAEAAFRRAIELNPSLAVAYLHYAYTIELYRQSDRSLPLGQQGVRLDPLSPMVLVNVAAQHWVAGNFDQALQLLEKDLQIDPGDAFAISIEAQVYCDSGQLEKAEELALRIREHPAWGYTYAKVLARSGRVEEARAELARIQESPRNVLALVLLNGELGDNDAVVRWLQVARDVRFPWYPWLITWFPDLEQARKDPRMRELAQEIGLEAYLD